MIKITMEIKDGRVSDNFEHENTTLSENALAIRYLEETKLKLLDQFEYKSQLEITEEK